MNFIEVQYDPAAHALAGEGFQYTLGPRWREFLKDRPAGVVILGIRPESIIVSLTVTPGAVPAKVYVMEQLGREILLDVKIGAQAMRAYVPSDTQLRIGQDVWLQFPEEAIYLFDPATELSLSWVEKEP